MQSRKEKPLEDQTEYYGCSDADCAVCKRISFIVTMAISGTALGWLTAFLLEKSGGG